jgi:hypothetical protein
VRIRIAFVLSCLVFSALVSNAQKPEQKLEQWAKTSPIEKIYLHFDREEYIAGETAWFKAYLSSDYFPGTTSTTLHVELVGSDKKVIDRKTVPVLLGSTSGQFDLGDSLLSGTYTIRAFTPSLVRQTPDYIFKKGIQINGKKRAENNTNTPRLNIEFFPEGGNLVTGFNNTVAFKASYENGMPATVKGTVRNSRNEEISTLSDQHDGMGLFEIKPVAGEKYTVSLIGSSEKFALPESVEKGITLTIIPHPQGNFFELQQRLSDPAFVAAYMVGQMQHHVVFRQELNKTKESLQGVINTQNLRSGILQVTFFNQDGIPLAERLCFVNNNEFLQPATLLLDTVDYTARARNRFRLSMTDTIQANISVSVIDASYTAPRYDNIVTSFLLTSDLPGYIHRPAFYLSSGADSVKTALDLLMMTNGWRRFKWTELARQTPRVYSAPAYITLDGRATLKGTNKPFADKDLFLLISNMGSKKGRNVQMLKTDRDGNFLIDSLLFFDRNRLLFSDIRGKKSQYIDITLKGDSLHAVHPVPGFAVAPSRWLANANSAAWQADYDAILKANGIMLEAVTIKVQKKTPTQLLDERYTSGAFNGDASKFIDLVNSNEAETYANIFDYLQFRVNGLQVASDGFDYSVYYRQGATMSSMGNIPMTLYLDEVETDASMIAAIPASQVALVKVYNNFVAATGNAPGGVLAIYTKKGEDYAGSAGVANVSIYNGYSIVKEFYAPDYKKNPGTDKADNRITIDWRPNIFINSIDPKVPISFYNNDRTRQFKIVVEGMTADGKYIWLEKTIDPK